MKALALLPIEEPSWYQRRFLRSLKKLFQSKCSGGVCSVGADGEEDGEVVVAKEACLIVGEVMLGFLNDM